MKFNLLLVILLFFNVLKAEEDPVSKIPMKAAALSFILPGAGQIYNENILKASAVIALETTVIGLVIYHHQKTEENYDRYLQTQLQSDYSRYVKYYNKRQSDYWWLGAIVLLSAVDAYVDAHLFDYESQKNKVRLKFATNSLSLEYKF